MLEIDHVLFPVLDLDAAATDLLDHHGIASVPGGRHPGHGTGNRIVPLGDTYLELIAVVDPTEAEASPMGRWVTRNASHHFEPVSLCLRTDDIEPIADALDEQAVRMVRQRVDGSEVAWCLVGLEEMTGVGNLPFYIQWETAPGDHPAQTAIDHPAGDLRLLEVVIARVPENRAFVAEANRLVLANAPVGVRRVVLAGRDGVISFSR